MLMISDATITSQKSIKVNRAKVSVGEWKLGVIIHHDTICVFLRGGKNKISD